MTGELRVSEPPVDRPLLLFDGDCGFCRWWVDQWARQAAGRVDYEPYQESASRFPEISREALSRAVHLVDTDGRVYAGAGAVFRALACRRGSAWPLWLYENIPGTGRVTEACYRFVARHRGLFSWVTSLILGCTAERPAYRVATHIFIRSLGVIYLIAFVSLWTQVDGLIGHNGILPLGPYLNQAAQQLGLAAYRRVPTLCWFDSGDVFLHLLCGGGVGLSILLIAGIFPTLTSAGLWMFYLSLTIAGRTFLGFQWDNLLLEAGVVAILLSPPVFRSRLAADPAPSRVAVFLAQCLLFKLMFLSGYVKLRSHDEAWWNLTALTYHYWTQCLPTWVAWYMDKLPLWFQKFSCGVMFVIELGFPFLIWAPGRMLRYVAFGGLVGLQVLIAVAGNYTFFNLLSVALCLFILNDRCLRSVEQDQLSPRWHRWSVGIVAIPILLVSSMIFLGTLGLRPHWPRTAIRLYVAADPFRSINGYGLFAVMTKTRPEIIVEGTLDGTTWIPYEFKWKPGRLDRRPAFVAPHQPRLDWQMWFAALGTVRDNPWFVNFLIRLLQGAPEVSNLLATNPFPKQPPMAIRATLYEYRFTSAEERRQTGAWWKRERVGEYCPAIRLDERTRGER